jgi:hypothetical protein
MTTQDWLGIKVGLDEWKIAFKRKVQDESGNGLELDSFILRTRFQNRFQSEPGNPTTNEDRVGKFKTNGKTG